MAEQSQKQRPTQRAWLRLDNPEKDLRRFLAHADELEHTSVRYLWALVLGIVAGTGLTVGLLLASL